jgi:cellulose synthase/poly-beta-1,6-N-acetylglucosamine synthase-like glycosyltransferase
MIERILGFVLVIVTGVYVTVAFLFLGGLFRRKRKGQSEQPDVSVIIAARNEERCIADCLTDLTHQTYPPDRYEIIVVNDGSHDRTAEIVGTFTREHGNIRLLQAPDPAERGLSPKKNALDTGIREAKGEIILTTDADCRIPPTWIEGMVGCFEPDVGVVIGFSQIGSPHEKPSLFERLQALDFLALMSAAAGSANVGIPLAASGQNFAYRRRVFEEVGGFTRIGHRVSGDDVLFLQVVRQQTAWRAVFAMVNGTFTTTIGQKTLLGFIEQRKRWASNGIYQYRLNKPFFAYIVAVFVMNLLLLTLVPYTLIGFWCLVLKVGVDLAVTLRGAILFRRKDLLRVFPLWTILQIPYIVVVGIGGTLGQVRWKGRRYEPSKP